MEKFPKKKFQELVKIIQYHNNLYYNDDNPKISDAEYDGLINDYRKIKKSFPIETKPVSYTHLTLPTICSV